MKNFDHLYELLKREIPELDLRKNEPMSRHTTFRIGGGAALMALPADEDQLERAVDLARQEGAELVYVGAGSNLLVDDGGLQALVIKTAPQMNAIRVEGTTMIACAGALMAQVANAAADRGLTGLEFAHGIPGSLGGAVTMDAGAYGGEMRQVVRSVRALNEQGQVQTLTAEECQFGYRHSVFSNGGWVVLSAAMELAAGDEREIRASMAELMRRRKEKQPLEYPSAGSTFKRPEGHFAGALIEQCGLKGCRIGGAQVSEKHAGFVINRGGATCADVLELINLVHDRVYEETGVELEPEVKYLR